jgi:hypothetical protein
MLKRFRATLRHYALIITKFNHTCMVIGIHCRPAQKHCTLCMLTWRFHHTRSFPFTFRNCIVRTFCIDFTCQYQYHHVFCYMSVFDRSLIRLTNRTNSCYKLQMIEIVPLYFTLSVSQYCNTGSRSSSLHRYSSFDDRKFFDKVINLFHIHNSKFCTRHMILQ